MARQLYMHVAKLFRPMQASGRLFATCCAHDLRMFLFTDDLHENPLAPTSVELTVKYLFPRTEVECASRDRHNNFAAHHLSLEVGVSIVFACVVMPIASFVRCKSLQKVIIVLYEARLIIIDIDTGCDVHRIHQDEAFPYPALLDDCFDLGRDIDVGSSRLCLEPEFFAVGLHDR